jgi:hypothetical protein
MGEDGVAATTPADGKNRRGKGLLVTAGLTSLAAGGMSGGSGRSALDEGLAAGSATRKSGMVHQRCASGLC